MEHISYLGGLPIRFTVNKTNQLENIITWTSILINLIIATTYEKRVHFNFTSTDIINPYILDTESLIMYLGYIHVFFSFLKTIYYVIINTKLIIRE